MISNLGIRGDAGGLCLGGKEWLRVVFKEGFA